MWKRGQRGSVLNHCPLGKNSFPLIFLFLDTDSIFLFKVYRIWIYEQTPLHLKQCGYWNTVPCLALRSWWCCLHYITFIWLTLLSNGAYSKCIQPCGKAGQRTVVVLLSSSWAHLVVTVAEHCEQAGVHLLDVGWTWAIHSTAGHVSVSRIGFEQLAGSRSMEEWYSVDVKYSSGYAPFLWPHF